MSDKSTALLSFNGSKYHLDSLMKVGKTGPNISIKLGEINLFDGMQDHLEEDAREPVNAEHCVQFTGTTEAIFQGVLFFKQHGKFTVLLGHDKVKEVFADPTKTHIKGYLISTPSLKTARKNEPQPSQQPSTVTPTTTYPEEFSNKPRFSNNNRRNDNNMRTGFASNALAEGVAKRIE